MVIKISAAFLTAAIVSGPVSAQEQLRVSVLDRIGAGTLDRDGYGCFDPVAALQFDEDVINGEVDDASQTAFAVGSCVVLESGAALENVQRISIKNQIFVRGAVADGDVTTYLPDWGASLAGLDNGYNAARMEVASPVLETAASLRTRVNAYEQCVNAGELLEARIDDYNTRAAKLDPISGEDETASRLTHGGGSVPVYKVYLPNEKFRELRAEALQLQQEVDEYWGRCKAFRATITLDKDYLTFFRAAE